MLIKVKTYSLAFQLVAKPKLKENEKIYLGIIHKGRLLKGVGRRGPSKKDLINKAICIVKIGDKGR